MTGQLEDTVINSAPALDAADSPPDSPEIEAAQLIYHTLIRAVKSWQTVNAGKLATWRPSGLSARLNNPGSQATGPQTPIFTLAELPDALIIDLWQQLNTRLGVKSTAQNFEEKLGIFKQTGTLAEQETLSALFMAISGVAGLARRQLPPQLLESVNEGWEKSVCPVCGEASHLALLVPPVGKRHLTCGTCGHEWPVRRVGCILCGSEEAKEQVYLRSESYPGVEMVSCQACGNSFKEIDLREHACADYVWEDLRTFPMNYAAEQWKVNNPAAGIFRS